jgi:O-antigen ligase
MSAVLISPVAAALKLKRAQVSIAHPGVSAFGILSTVVLATFLLIRWREGFLAEFSRLRWSHFLPWILLAIVFAIGFFRAVQLPYAEWLKSSSEYSLLPLLQGNLKSSNNSLHYVFLSHWVVYIALGILACARLAELNIFLIAFSLLYVVTIFPLPVEFYPYFFEKIYFECQPMGLHNMTIGGDRITQLIAGNVNRSQVGYLAAMASLISLSLAHHQGGRLRNMFYIWSLLAAVVVFLAGSKGCALGWVIGVFIVMRFADKQAWVRSLVVVGVIAAAIGVSTLAGHSPIPCGTVKQYASVQSSYDTRVSLIEGGLDIFFQGLHASTSPWQHVLVGEGFGASARANNPHTGQMLIEAGSHNLFIDLLVDTGGVGLVLFLLALYLLIIGFVRPLLRQDFPHRRLFMAAMGGMFIVDLIMLLVTTTTYREYLGAFLIGLLMGSAVYMTQRHPPSPPHEYCLEYYG